MITDAQISHGAEVVLTALAIAEHYGHDLPHGIPFSVPAGRFVGECSRCNRIVWVEFDAGSWTFSGGLTRRICGRKTTAPARRYFASEPAVPALSLDAILAQRTAQRANRRAWHSLRRTRTVAAPATPREPIPRDAIGPSRKVYLPQRGLIALGFHAQIQGRR